MNKLLRRSKKYQNINKKKAHLRIEEETKEKVPRKIQLKKSSH